MRELTFRNADRKDTALILGFYLSLGAEEMSEWTVYRVAGETLQRLAGNSAKSD